MNVYTKRQRIAETAKQLLRTRVRDGVITRLIGKWLKAGVLEALKHRFEAFGTEKLKKMNEWCRKYRHFPLWWQHGKLCRKLKGHYAYYGITGNIISLQDYLREVTRIWKKWLNRRSWRDDKLTWDRFRVLLKEHIPLPPAKIVHSIYAAKP
jgi:hypothetical protein